MPFGPGDHNSYIQQVATTTLALGSAAELGHKGLVEYYYDMHVAEDLHYVQNMGEVYLVDQRLVRLIIISKPRFLHFWQAVREVWRET